MHAVKSMLLYNDDTYVMCFTFTFSFNNNFFIYIYDSYISKVSYIGMSASHVYV